MSLRANITDYSRGNDIRLFWYLYKRQQRAKTTFTRDILTFLMSRCANKLGGYVGPGAVITGLPCLPHGLHGIFISRYAVIGSDCRIYQNVTIGEINNQAPSIGDGCFIGAGAVLVGNIKIGNYVKVGAGAIVNMDVPDYSTVVSQPSRILEKRLINYES